MSTSLRDQQQRAAARFRDAEAAREATQQQQAATGVRIADTPEQLAARVERRFAGTPEVAAALRTVAATPQARVLERVLAGNDQQGVAFLARGARAAETVGKVSLVENGRFAGSGTGFLVAGRLLLTNNHVLTDAGVAAGSFVEFDVEVGPDGVPETAIRYALDPATVFVTDVDLDFSLVAVRPAGGGSPPGERFGSNPLIAAQGKLVVGEAANLIGHPAGRPKEIAIRNNDLLDQVERFLHYRTDSEPGSSGSPVFNDQWEVVALHHSGVPSTDAEGHLLTADGTRWDASMGEDAIAWIANEGVRVSAILTHLAALDLPVAQRAVLDELGPQAVPQVVAPGSAGGARPGPTVVERAVPGARPRSETPPHLVFLHGRSQQGRDPVVLRSTWAGGLARGLGAGGLPPIDPADIWFPFYGDVLAGLVDGGARTDEAFAAAPSSAAERAAPSSPSARVEYAALITEAADRAGFDRAPAPDPARELSVGDGIALFQRPLSWIAATSGLDDLFVALHFRDVAMYLDDENVRSRVLDAVLATIPASGPTVLVSHSLGTVVALDLATRLGRDADLRLLVTAGSPLGMDAVHKRLLGGAPRRPAGVRWVNAWCPADAVAIGCPLGATWGSGIVEVVTDNPRDRAHDIGEYLADPRVAGEIATAVRPGP